MFCYNILYNHGEYMIKYEKYVKDQERIQSARDSIIGYRGKWKVSEAQVSRYVGLSLTTLRAFMQGLSKSYREKTLVAIERFFKREQREMD